MQKEPLFILELLEVEHLKAMGFYSNSDKEIIRLFEKYKNYMKILAVIPLEVDLNR